MTLVEEVKALKNNLEQMAETLRKEFTDINKEFRLQITKSRSTLDTLEKFFKITTDRNTEIIVEFMKQYIEVLGLEVDAKKLGEVFDNIYQRKMYLYDVQGFVSDLASDNKNERIRAIWGIEGIGIVENIKDLQKIVDDPHEDPNIRVEAQRAVDNMKRRFGIQ